MCRKRRHPDIRSCAIPGAESPIIPGFGDPDGFRPGRFPQHVSRAEFHGIAQGGKNGRVSLVGRGEGRQLPTPGCNQPALFLPTLIQDCNPDPGNPEKEPQDVGAQDRMEVCNGIRFQGEEFPVELPKTPQTPVCAPGIHRKHTDTRDLLKYGRVALFVATVRRIPGYSRCKASKT